jgi:WS/DGAT/MGAT family acyltransferase
VDRTPRHSIEKELSMARYSYDRLTALDNSFLVLETPNAYMHVGSTLIHEAGPFRRKDGGIDAEAIKSKIESLLHLIPRYRQKLATAPILGHPVWVDDPDFSIDYHIRHTSLPRPGSMEQLMRLSARIMQQHLDRRRPLWEMWIAEGLEKDRFAVISKVHHCMIDGVSGVDLMRVLMSPDPANDVYEAPAYIPRKSPSGTELLANEVLRWASLPLRAASGIGALVSEAQDVRHTAITTVRAVAATLGASLRPTSGTPLNGQIGPHRRLDWMPMSLAEVKKIRNALGGSINDVVLTVVTGAVRRFLERRQVDTERIGFRVMAPVSVRSDAERGKLGNRVSAWVIDLPIGEPDPVRQLRAISERTAELKQSKSALGAEVLTQVAEWTPSTLLALGARNATRLLPFNMVVTNVPGPQLPIYLFGARMLECYPHVPLTEGLGLGIALMSYDGTLYWGLNADYELMPDLPAFTAALRSAFKDLTKLAEEATAIRMKQSEAEQPAPPRRVRRASPAKPIATRRATRNRANGAARPT